jgi:hypothetical protein
MSGVTIETNLNCRSYVDQCLHYLDRPHEGVPSGPVDSPSAWRGSEIRDLDGWRFEFSEAEIAEIEDALRCGKETGKPLANWTVDDFPLPGLQDQFNQWRGQIRDGLGMVLLTGLPVREWSAEDSECFFWAFGLHLGIPGAQNPQGDLLGHVTRTSAYKEGDLVRLYQTPESIAYHCDAADVVGLLCLEPAAQGGASRIASSVTVWNEIWKRNPEFAARLFDPVYVDLREERSPEGNPWYQVTPCKLANNRLSTFYHGDYFRSAKRHGELNISEADLDLFDLYDSIANDPEICFDMELAAGDIQLISNHTVIHARTKYQDSPTQRRHLLRLWLSL